VTTRNGCVIFGRSLDSPPATAADGRGC